MKIEVQHVDETGSGYCVVHLDDGSSFGQRFNDLPVDDADAFNDALVQVAEQAVTLRTPALSKRIAPEVLARIGVKVDAVRTR